MEGRWRESGLWMLGIDTFKRVALGLAFSTCIQILAIKPPRPQTQQMIISIGSYQKVQFPPNLDCDFSPLRSVGYSELAKCTFDLIVRLN